MSGGTDSSVAAMLLQDAGYEVTGVTFRFYEKDGNCEYIDDAVETASKLGIRHLVYDARADFEKRIIRYFVDEYFKGRTPVPCVICNKTFKWPLLAKIADETGIYHIATGHYAQIITVNNLKYIYRGADPDKDQSFFLWGMEQSVLNRMVLPLGKLRKTQVRMIAAQRGYQKAAIKKDSTGVCFCPGDYRSFLEQYAGSGKIERGFYEDVNKNIIGKHMGYPFYTVGQRRGLGIHFQYPVFVKEIIPESNRVIISTLDQLYKTRIKLEQVQVASKADFSVNTEIICKIRYRKQETPCRVCFEAGDQATVHLLEPLHAIAPGQSAVFYSSGRVLGGGIILSAE